MITPTPEQAAVLAHRDGPLRISAGAGTGKTTTVALYVRSLVEDGTPPEEILGITFTNKAASELADRIRSILADVAGPGREAEVHTYHGFAASLVREFGALAGIERETPVITPTFARQILYDVLQRREFRHLDATWVGSVDKVQRFGAALEDHLVDPNDLVSLAEDAEPWPERLELLAAWGDYRAEKRRLGVVDYSDLISAAVTLLTRHPDVATRIRSRFRVVLLDEYQDTNPAQRILLQSLFGDGFPVVAVGDTDQTIYEWRGATPDNFHEFIHHFPHGDGRPARELSLTLNRRSDRLIVATANEIRRQIEGGGEDLEALPGAGTGSVAVHWAADAVAEADWIADRVLRLHQEGVPWREIAILFRKNRHVALVHDALTEREIPIEVANLGGLLSVPEVADVRAWMRVLHSPEDGPALLRILTGPRYRLGLGDLAHLSRWASRPGEETDLDHEGLPAHTMLEAIENLEDVEGSSGRARRALERFRREFRTLLEVAHGDTLAELARAILEVTGAWKEVEAMSPAGRLSARLNLYRFLDLTEEWSPLEGRPSLAAFLAHLELMEENPADELDAARLSGEDAVALLTVHRSKGLEWDVVFIPAVSQGNFPSRSSGFENPYTRPQWLPHELRRDTPPPFDAATDPKLANDILRDRHLRQEWRTAYVAVTRARHRLFVTGSHWYGVPVPNQRPATPSPLFELIAGLPFTDDLGQAPLAERPEILRAPDREPAPDPLFPDGWAAAVRAALADPSHVETLAEARGVTDQVEDWSSTIQQRLFELEQVPTVARPEAAPVTSVTGLVTFAACPRRYYWTEVDPLPRRPSPAARRGADIHRRIELHSLGRVPLVEFDPESYDMVEADRAEPKTDPFAAYLSSPYASTRPVLVESAFELPLSSGLRVRGRIDAVYPTREEGWEIVDFKTGRRRSDPWLEVQLQAYAVAIRSVDFGPRPPEGLAASFVYLGDGVDVDRRDVDAEWLSQAQDRLESIGRAIIDDDFEPTPSPACRNCDFQRFCAAGRAWLEENGP